MASVKGRRFLKRSDDEGIKELFVLWGGVYSPAQYWSAAESLRDVGLFEGQKKRGGPEMALPESGDSSANDSGLVLGPSGLSSGISENLS